MVERREISLASDAAKSRDFLVPGRRLGVFSCYGVFAMMLGAAGLPIYIHAPKYFVDQYGVSLSTLGLALFVLRSLDFVQDPILAALAQRSRERGQWPIYASILLLGLGMLGLFALAPPFSAIIWFSLCLAMVFSAFSFLSIRFYANGVHAFGAKGQLRLARWRETGSLLGICVAAIAPTLLLNFSAQPFAIFALGFCGLCLIAGILMRGYWHPISQAPASVGIAAVLSDRQLRHFLLLAMLNSAPVAVSSTLFLFYVESRLGAADWAGALLILFFLAAAISAPIWTYLAARFGPKQVLLLAMSAAIIGFFYAYFLQEGQIYAFALISLVSGATLGADMTLLPALFASHLAQRSNGAEIGFGLWNFVSKMTLAFAAVLVLPLLEWFGYQPGLTNAQKGLTALSSGYALFPCLLKMLAIVALVRLPMQGHRK